MILNVIWLSWASLRRDRVLLLLGYLVPLVFFSIYVGMGTLGRSYPPSAAALGPLTLGVVDEDRSDMSGRLIQTLRAQPGLVLRQAETATPLVQYDPATAQAALHDDRIAAALIVHRGFGTAPLDFLPGGGGTVRLELLVSGADPLAAGFYGTIVQHAALSLAPDVLSSPGPQSVDGWVGGLAPSQRAHMSEYFQRWRDATARPRGTAGPVGIAVRSVAHEAAPDPTVAYYAAAMGVMTILFSAVSGATGLIEEGESGMLARALSSRLSLFELFSGKLVFTALFCLSQLAAIFVWAAVAFHLDLLPHLGGWLAVSLATSFAAAAFSLAVAVFCRTRMRIFALSGLIVLGMGALGGSMFPRFLMPDLLQKLGLVTFNAWALDGFSKAFVQQVPILMLWPQIGALAAFTLFFFASSLWLGRRWEFS